MEDVVEATAPTARRRARRGPASDRASAGSRCACARRGDRSPATASGSRCDRHYASLPSRPVGRTSRTATSTAAPCHAVGLPGHVLELMLIWANGLHQPDEQAADERPRHRRHAADDRRGEGGDEDGGRAVAGVEL